MSKTLTEKLTTRNFIAIATILTFLGSVAYTIVYHPEMTENPLFTYLLGQFSTVVGLIYYFYFRKPQSKESTATP
ncbi:MAG: hypothetical protein HZC29_01100 [Thaumarchaeota archaeon]|nr:hypothetical protein [Nitrososphaerota archaeon]